MINEVTSLITTGRYQVGPICIGIENEFSFLVFRDGEYTAEDGDSEATNDIIRVVKEGRFPVNAPELCPLSEVGEFLRKRTYGEFIANGSRLYNDMTAPELSTGECMFPSDVLLHERAGGVIVQRAAEEVMRDKQDVELHLFRKNSDGQGNTYGSHENYSVSEGLFKAITNDAVYTDESRILATFLIFRQIITGAGKVGFECNGRTPCVFQISQRADFMERTISASTTGDRPIIQTREEGHGDKNIAQRLHIIIGDMNVCELPIYLKVGLTALLLIMMDKAGTTFNVPVISDMDSAPYLFRASSRDISLSGKYEMIMPSGVTVECTAVEVLEHYLAAMRLFLENADFEHPLAQVEFNDVVKKATNIALLLKNKRFKELMGVLDWVTKLRLLRGMQKRRRITWNSCLDNPMFMRDARKAIDLGFSRVDPQKSWYARMDRRGQIKRKTTNEQIERAILEPPAGRAKVRTALIERFPTAVSRVNWEYVTFKYMSPDGELTRTKIQLRSPFGYESPKILRIIRLAKAPWDLCNAFADANISEILVERE